MPNLFAWFQNYLNPSKLTAVTVPGMVLAFALILVLGPIPCQKKDFKSCPYCVSTLKPVKDSTTSTANSADKPSSSKDSDGEQMYVRVSQAPLKQEGTTGGIDRLIRALDGDFNKFSQPDKTRSVKEPLIPVPMAPVPTIDSSCDDVPSYFAPNSTKVSEKTIGAGPLGRFNTDGS